MGSVTLKHWVLFVSWRKCELQNIDRKNKQLLTMYAGLHPKYYKDRSDIPRKEVGRVFVTIKDWVESAVKGLN